MAKPVFYEYKEPTTRKEYLDEQAKFRKDGAEWTRQRNRLRKPGFETLDNMTYGGKPNE